MSRRVWMVLFLLLVVPGLLVTASCGKKKTISSAGTVSGYDADAADRARQAEEEARQLQEASLAEEARQKAQMAQERFVNADVYFDFDSAVLQPEAQAVLAEKADWLKANVQARAIVEGHCDERGTNEYNLALGDRRAESAKGFLVDLGISPSRLSTISYGEEKPVDTGKAEAAYAKNRRAHFVLK